MLGAAVSTRVVAEAAPSAGVAAASVDRGPARTKRCRCGRRLNSEAQAGEASERDEAWIPSVPVHTSRLPLENPIPWQPEVATHSALQASTLRSSRTVPVRNPHRAQTPGSSS